MESADFRTQARATVNGFLGRVPQNQRMALSAAMAGGELRIAVEQLVLTLSMRQVPVAPAERDILIRLVDHLEEEELRTCLDSLNISASDPIEDHVEPRSDGR